MADEPTPITSAGSDGDEGGSGSSIDFGVIGGILMAFGAVIIGLLIEGSSPGRYVSPSAAIIVFGGTFGATMGSVGLERFKQMPGSFMRALTYQSMDRAFAINTLVTFAERARREGLLVLEDDLRKTEDEFLRKGVQLVVDGTDPELVKEILRTEIDSLHEERHAGAKVWALMGGYAPTLGIIGTVVGLVLVLSNIADPSSLAASIAVAFIATLYGVGSANLIFLPIGTKLEGCATDEVAGRELMIEGILAIQSGDNPRIVEEKLVSFLTTTDRAKFRAAQGAGSEDIDLDLAA
ncbi:MAG: chemotaxis protein MotA [Thermoleophilia bacterium]|nr:chemotaxis protein MotA [Thermoleophilia bacterium]